MTAKPSDSQQLHLTCAAFLQELNQQRRQVVELEAKSKKVGEENEG